MPTRRVGGRKGVASYPVDATAYSTALVSTETTFPRPGPTRRSRNRIKGLRRNRATPTWRQNRGVEFVEPPEERPYGIDSGFRDPSGNSFRLTQVREIASV